MTTEMTLVCDECKKLVSLPYATLNEITSFAFEHRLHEVKVVGFISTLDDEDQGYGDCTHQKGK